MLTRNLLLFSILPGFWLSVSAEEDPSRSLNQGTDQVSVVVSNQTGNPLTLQWMDFSGSAQDYGSIAPRETVTLETFPGHLWMLGNDQQVVVRYRATNDLQQSLTLGGSGVAASSQPVPQPVPPPALPTPQTPAATQQTGSAFTSQEANAMLQFHNQVRAEVGVGPVQWSPEIARFAQQWADELAGKGKFEHRPRSRQQYGENLAAGSSPTYSPLEGARQWYEEKKLFRAPNGVFTAALMPAGHYTQMVWRGSTEIGAGKAVIRKGKMKGWTVIVCNYNPPGNMIGAKVY